jgi:hypothetical protein
MSPEKVKRIRREGQSLSLEEMAGMPKMFGQRLEIRGVSTTDEEVAECLAESGSVFHGTYFYVASPVDYLGLA